MRSDKNIFIAFLLNFLFSAVELIGGIFTGSIAIISDALHDFGDAAAIAVSAFLEHKSKRPADNTHTYGYSRYSVIGGAINAIILLVGSVIVVYGSVMRFISPSPIHYDGMLIMAVFGVIVNSLAAYTTHGGHSMNERTINLHMLEDVLGWLVVLVGAIVMRFTDWWFIDPLMSLCVAIFIFIHAAKNMAQIVNVLLEKVPENISVEELKTAISELPGVEVVHHIHVWSLDGDTVLATMHIVTQNEMHHVKDAVRHLCEQNGIHHVTMELECTNEHSHEHECNIKHENHEGCHHHHHHHA